jgi:hypothetical protein
MEESNVQLPSHMGDAAPVPSGTAPTGDAAAAVQQPVTPADNNAPSSTARGHDPDATKQMAVDENWGKLKMFLLKLNAFNSALPQPELDPETGQPWQYKIQPGKKKADAEWDVALQLVCRAFGLG